MKQRKKRFENKLDQRQHPEWSVGDVICGQQLNEITARLNTPSSNVLSTSLNCFAYVERKRVKLMVELLKPGKNHKRMENKLDSWAFVFCVPSELYRFYDSSTLHCTARILRQGKRTREKGISNLFYFNVLEPFFMVHSSLLLGRPFLSYSRSSHNFWKFGFSFRFPENGCWSGNLQYVLLANPADDSDVFSLLMARRRTDTNELKVEKQWREHKSYRLCFRELMLHASNVCSNKKNEFLWIFHTNSHEKNSSWGENWKILFHKSE